MQFPKRMLVSAVWAAGAIAGPPAFAHHSFAMFDNTKSIALEGTIKEFQWTNPHSWVRIVVTDGSSKETEYLIEGGSPNGLARQGWKRSSLKPGDKVVLVMHPLKDGTAGGSLVNVSIGGVPIGSN